MLNNLLSYDFKLFNSGLETGLFVLILGMIVVFLGMGVIVLVISGIGKVLTAAKNKKTEAPAAKSEPSAAPSVVPAEQGVPQEVVVAITAAIASYYSQSGSNCEFVVKKIKKRG